MYPLQNEKGIALITMLMFLVILTVIGVNAISMTSLENKTAKNERIYETRINYEEGGIEPQITVLEETIFEGAIPNCFLSSSSCGGTGSGGGPVVSTANLQNEILGQIKEDDSVSTTGNLGPDISITLGSSIVNMDTDYLFTRPSLGSSIEFASAGAGAGGGAGSGGVEIYYQFISEATVEGGSGTITNVYDCVISNGCQK
ncbi:pilus assembly PilX N-terminal domain-containing protein [Nitrospira defluvii]|nr:pilus assembly PilX N-terminal domain-containing protein [Nitrospira defluvii]